MCQRCLFIFEEMSKGLRFSDKICPKCNEMIYITNNCFKSLEEAQLKKEELIKKRGWQNG